MKNTKTVLIAVAIIASVVGTGLVAEAAVVRTVRVLRLVSLRKKAPVVKMLAAPPKTAIDKALEGLKTNIPIFDLSSSPIPNIKIAPLNLALPALPGKGLMKNFTVNTNVGYTGGAVKIEAPQIDVSKYIPQIPTGIPSGIPTVTTPTVTTPAETTPTVTAPAASTVNVANCAQFSGVPSCSYVGDANGQTLCNQCKTAGF